MTLAHGSGIDELLMFGIPVIVAVVALRVAEKRAKRRIEGEGKEIDGPETSAS